MKNVLTVGSLFAGIGGFDLGLERTGGFKTKWQVEIDPYCQRVLAKHWPDVTKYGDIRTVTGVERVDVLCGGFPCQDISNAGKRAGIDGERSGLWSEYVRLIRELRPRYVLLENVAALLGRGMGRVLGGLSESGYDAEWRIIRASELGAPHRRDRVWILAYSDSQGLARPGTIIGTKPIRSSCGSWRAFAETISDGPLGPGLERYTSLHKPMLCRDDDGIPKWMDRVKGLGNAIVPQIAEWIGHQIMKYEESL